MNRRRNIPIDISVQVYRRAKNSCEVRGCRFSDCEFNLEMHHKDGNPSNNRLKNLELLCPNHHSARRYRGSDYYWLRKGVEQIQVDSQIKREEIFRYADELSHSLISRKNTHNFDRLTANNIIRKVDGKRGWYSRVR
jgi:hypothetical protein